MTADRNLRLSLLLLVLIGAFIMSLGEESYLFFAIALAACGAHWFGIDDWHGIKQETASGIVTIAAVLCLLERLLLRHYVIICTAHFLAIAQLVILFCKPSNRNLMWIILITLAHAAVGTVRTVEIGYGLCIVLLSLCGSWALILFLVKREAEGASPATNGLLRPSLSIGTLIFAVSLVLFFSLPRVQANIFRQNAIGQTQPISGFADRVVLGDLGRIIKSSQKVMDVTLFRNDELFQAAGMPLYWRGTSMDSYDLQGGRWSWMSRKRHSHYLSLPDIPKQQRGFARGGDELKQVFNLEPLNTKILFCLYPIQSLKLTGAGRRPALVFDGRHGTLSTWAPRRSSIFTYEVVSQVMGPGTERRLRPHDRLTSRVLRPYRHLPARLDGRIAELARRVAAGAGTDREKATLVQKHLRDSGDYVYSLDMAATPGVEPIADFLFTRRSGHCEYFASAMVVMLRALGIPARMVNGFLGGEWNSFGSFYTVRQSHAHSWVEAYFDDTGWVPLDPTPRVDEALPLGTEMLGALLRFVDYLDVTWVNWFIAYSREDQRQLFGSAQDRLLAADAFRRVEQFINARLSRITALLNKAPERAPSSAEEGGASGWLRIGKVIAVLLLTILTVLGIVVLIYVLTLALLGRRARSDAPGVMYGRFIQAMRRHGFRREDGQTPWEFAHQIAATAPELGGDVWEITTRFCMARYGGKAIAPTMLEGLGKRIKKLAKAHR